MPFPQVFAGQTLTADVINATRKRLIIQTADQVLTDQDTEIDTEIIIPVEAGATYWYECLISYSAVSAASSALTYSWDAPTGTALARFTQSYITQPGTGSNTGSLIIQRRPANTTGIPAGGSDASSPPTNFHSAYDRGTISVGGISGNVVLQVRQAGSGSSNETILRGGNQTRCFYERIL